MAKKSKKNDVAVSLPDLEQLGSDVRRLFNMPMTWNISTNRFPSMDMVEEGSKIKITADLPGIDKSKIKVTVDGNSVMIKAAANSQKEQKGRNYYYRERSSAGYYRNVLLPKEVDANSAKAEFSNGILNITLEKSHKRNAARKDVKIE